MVLPWRDGLEKELGFEERFLPLLWVKAQGEEAQIRLKYMDLVTRLYNENFTKVIGDCAGITVSGIWVIPSKTTEPMPGWDMGQVTISAGSRIWILPGSTSSAGRSFRG